MTSSNSLYEVTKTKNLRPAENECFVIVYPDWTYHGCITADYNSVSKGVDLVRFKEIYTGSLFSEYIRRYVYVIVTVTL